MKFTEIYFLIIYFLANFNVFLGVIFKNDMFLTYFSTKYSCYLTKCTIFALIKYRMQAYRIDTNLKFV